MSLYKGNNLISGAMPNSANQSLSNLDSAGQDKFDAKVNKAGDTMTGALSIISTNPRIQQSNEGLTKGETPSEAYYMGLLFNDKNSDSASHYSETRLGMIEHQSLLDGTERIVIAPYRNVANSTDNAAFSISIPQSGGGYCSFPKTTCVDGQWVSKNTTLASNITWQTNTAAKTYSLSSYLPNDGKNYEVYLYAQCQTAATAGKFVRVGLTSDICNYCAVVTARTRTAAAVENDGFAVIPVGTGRTLRQYSTDSANAQGTYWIYLLGYRRIGTNG